MARAVIGTLPLGSMLKEMFTGIVADPAQRRRDAIIRDLLIRLKRLEQNAELDLGQLAAREDFVATFVRVIQAASREIEKEKMVLLKNAVINTAMGDDLEPSVRAMLLGILEQATLAHVAMLQKLKEQEQTVESILLANAPNKAGAYNERGLELRRTVLSELFRMHLVRHVRPQIGELSIEGPDGNERDGRIHICAGRGLLAPHLRQRGVVGEALRFELRCPAPGG